jgi:hypothetical protein
MVVVALFIARFVSWRFGLVIAALFIIAMVLLTLGLLAFLHEVRISLRSIHVRAELLEEEQRR